MTVDWKPNRRSGGKLSLGLNGPGPSEKTEHRSAPKGKGTFTTLIEKGESRGKKGRKL